MKWFEPQDFNWDDNPPLSSFQTVLTTSITYTLAVILTTFLSRKFRPISTYQTNLAHKKKKDDDGHTTTTTTPNQKTTLQWIPWFDPQKLEIFQIIHNIILVTASAIMLGGVVWESHRRIISEYGSLDKLEYPSFLLCETVDDDDNNGARGSLYYWSYVYYLSKYYELLDTALQLARGKPPPHFVLHVFHHAVVLIMAWGWCETKMSLQFIALAWNVAVHVVMYTYFLQRTVTSSVPRWKKFVTLMQIAQFTFSAMATAVTCFAVFVQKYECSGIGSVLGNIVFNMILLNEFVGVFRKGQKKPKASMVSV